MALALLAAAGCGPAKESTPPNSESVTTEELQIEIPSGDKAGPKSEPGGKTESPPAEAGTPKGQKPA